MAAPAYQLLKPGQKPKAPKQPKPKTLKAPVGKKPPKPKGRKKPPKVKVRKTKRGPAALGKGKPNQGIKHADRVALGYGVGADPLTVMRQATPKQRQLLRKSAAKKGATISGYIKGGPVALQEKSSAGLRDQAVRTTKAAYAPSYADVGAQETNAKNLDSKRAQDEAYYQQWLGAKQAEIGAQAQASDKLLLDAQTAGRADIVQKQGDIEAKGRAAVAAAPGGTWQEGQQPSQLDNGVETKRQLAVQDSQDKASIQRALVNSGTRASFGLSNIAFGQGRRKDQQNQLTEALKTLGQQRHKLQLSEGADTAKEIARLSDMQVTIQQGTRDYEVAAKKLGIDAYQARTTAQDKKARQKEQAKKNKNENRIKLLTLRLQGKTLTETQRHNTQAELNTLKGIDQRDSASKRSDATTRAGQGGGKGSSNAPGGGGPKSAKAANTLYTQIKGYTKAGKSMTTEMYKYPGLMKAAAEEVRGGIVGNKLADAVLKKYGVKVPRAPKGDWSGPHPR